jgi:hypothetical protein
MVESHQKKITSSFSIVYYNINAYIYHCPKIAQNNI